MGCRLSLALFRLFLAFLLARWRAVFAVSRVVKYALSLSTVTFALAFGGFVDGLELGFNCVGNVKFCGFLQKSVDVGLDRFHSAPCRLKSVMNFNSSI